MYSFIYCIYFYLLGFEMLLKLQGQTEICDLLYEFHFTCLTDWLQVRYVT